MTHELERTHLPAPPLPPGRPNLVVAGFMGTGKSAAGRAAAHQLGLPFVDLDDVVERRAGRSIAEIVARDGEGPFRTLERDALRDAARMSGTVIAVGGGAVLDSTSFGALAERSVVTVLTCQRDELVRRLREGSARPLLAPDPVERVTALLEERTLAYQAAGRPLDTTGRTVEETARELGRRYVERAPGGDGVRIEVAGAGSPYPVVVGRGAIDHIGTELVPQFPEIRKAAVVCDNAVRESVGEPVRTALIAASLAVGPLVRVGSGETVKSSFTLAGLWDSFHDQGLDRSDVVVAVGGGATLDVAGFAAATFARGLALVNVPTTLLAMVDAGLGGKVGIDHAGVKNRVGAFHDPVLVLDDTSTLETLPTRSLTAGLAECVKAAVIASPLFVDILEDLGPRAAEATNLPWLIEQSVRVKAVYVASDPRERGLRRSLNLGHTFAHAIEAVSGYGVSHGEAVAIGVVAAARLGAALAETDPGLAGRLERLLARLGLPVGPPVGLGRRDLAAAMTADKKRRAGRDAFVVPAPGGVTIVEAIDLADIAVRMLDPTLEAFPPQRPAVEARSDG